MAITTRYPNGVTNSAITELTGDYGVPDPTKWHTFMNDFDQYVAGDFVVTNTGVATQALVDIDGGVLRVTNAGLDNDASFLQKVGESFKFEVGKKLFFKTRFAINGDIQVDCVAGLQITDTTPLAVTDGVYFLKSDGSADINLLVTKNSTSSTLTAVGTLATNIYTSLGFYYDGVSTIKCYVDDVAAGTLPVTNLPDDEDLTVSFGVQNGDATARNMKVDYIFVAKER